MSDRVERQEAQHDPRGEPASVSTLRSRLARVRRLAWLRLVFSAFALVVALAILGIFAFAGLDFLLRLPKAARFVVWVAGLAGISVALWRFVRPAWGFHPRLSDVALRLEELPEAQAAGIRGVLTSGLELGRIAPEQADSLAKSALERLDRGGVKRLYRAEHLRRALVWGGVAAIVVVTLGAWTPTLMGIGTRRVLTPWANVSWPKRTGVENATEIRAFALGSAVPLRAVLTKSTTSADQAEVSVFYRARINGIASEARRALMTFQPRAEGDTARSLTLPLFERLVETTPILASAGSVGKEVPENEKIELEYWFESSDDATDVERLRLVRAPRILSASVRVDPPEYADADVSSAGVFVHGSRGLPIETTDRVTIAPILARSMVTLELLLNKPIPVVDPAQPDGGVGAMFSGFAENAAPLLTRDATRWTLTLHATSAMTLLPRLVDSFGIESEQDTAFAFDVLEDTPPTSAILSPASDESVLASAVVEIVGEARDDVGVRSLIVQRQTARPPGNSAGAPAEAIEEPVEFITAGTTETSGSRVRVRAESTLDLAPLGVTPGDEIWLTAIATDGFDLGESPRGPVVSPVRRLLVISDAQLVEEIRTELQAVRDAARRLEEEQSRLTQSLGLAAAQHAAARQQRAVQNAIRDRLHPVDETLDRLESRVTRNRLDDDAIKDLLGEAGELVQRASDAAESAEGALDALAQDETSSDAREAARSQAEKAQREAARNLTELAALLESGQDSWAIRRTLERLLSDQRQIQSQTRAAAAETQGKPLENLTEQQRVDLERLGQRQEELSRTASAAIDTIEQRAQHMQQADPGQANAMRQAAQRAREAQLAERQRDAAQQIRQNQTGRADQQQEQAAEALQQMLEQLQQVERERDAALRRQVAEVLELIRGLIAMQQGELKRLIDAGEGDLTGLDAGMVALDKATLGVIDRAEGDELGQVRAHLNAAESAQAQAVGRLRASPPTASLAEERERESLARLVDAEDAAKKVDEDASEREQDRQRAELAKKYAEILELQVALSAETEAFAGKDLTRRDRLSVRALGAKQAELRERVKAMESEAEGLTDAVVFAFAHRRIDGSMQRASAALGEGAVPTAVRRDQTLTESTLASLLRALAEAKKKRDEFEEDSGGGGGGGGGGSGGPPPLVPPVAQLKLLRDLQAEAATLTRDAADNNSTDDARAASELQGEITGLAKKLLEELSNSGETPPETPEEPAQPPAPPGGAS
ncbi:MAG: hypothetical protein IPK69_11400 [Phycisphaerales bacterium]|nr:MAG: hypothetical protein IPK69_11400 [Phycisphaerales bacterium]